MKVEIVSREEIPSVLRGSKNPIIAEALNKIKSLKENEAVKIECDNNEQAYSLNSYLFYHRNHRGRNDKAPYKNLVTCKRKNNIYCWLNH